MYSDLIKLLDDNQRLRDERDAIIDAVIIHAQKTQNIGYSVMDRELWEAIGLHVYTDEEKAVLTEEERKRSF